MKLKICTFLIFLNGLSYSKPLLCKCSKEKMTTKKTISSHLDTFDLSGKRVFLRADLNVPLQNNTVAHDQRLRAVLPTIDLIQKKGGKVICATHLGRPKGHDPKLSAQSLANWFASKGYLVEFEDDLNKAHEKSLQNPETILLLENLRFFPGEKSGNKEFAQQLARLGDFYVNDAFGLLHRTDTSITLVPELFPPEKRTIGLLIEQELSMLNKLLDNPAKPFTLIIGGGKVHDKLPLLENMLDSVDTILLCPAIVFTFLKAMGKEVGISLVDDNALPLCKKLLDRAQQKKVKIVLPIDYQTATDSLDGPLSFVDADGIPKNGMGISIGPKTAALFDSEIKKSNTIFINCGMGFLHRPDTLRGLEAILKSVGKSQAFSVIGGGETVAFSQMLGLDKNISYSSTGGGATLTYLSGGKLPGLAFFNKN